MNRRESLQQIAIVAGAAVIGASGIKVSAREVVVPALPLPPEIAAELQNIADFPEKKMYLSVTLLDDGSLAVRRCHF